MNVEVFNEQEEDILALKVLLVSPLLLDRAESSGKNSPLSCRNHTSSVIFQDLHLLNLQYKRMLLPQTYFNRTLMSLTVSIDIVILSKAGFKFTSPTDSLICIARKKI